MIAASVSTFQSLFDQLWSVTLRRKKQKTNNENSFFGATTSRLMTFGIRTLNVIAKYRHNIYFCTDVHFYSLICWMSWRLVLSLSLSSAFYQILRSLTELCTLDTHILFGQLSFSEWLRQYNRPLSVSPWQKLVCELATKSWWKLTMFADCWLYARDFRLAAQATPDPLMKY